jgi:hypothetical protein
MRAPLLTIAATLLFASTAFAQADGRARVVPDTSDLIRSVRLFGYGSGFGVWHVADFPGMPDVPSCCTSYGSTFGLGWEIGVGALWRIDTDLHAGLRVGYGSVEASFMATEPTVILKPLPRSASIEHSIETMITTMSYAPTVQWYLDSSLYVTGALVMRYALATSMVQREVLQSPDGAVFLENGTVERNRYEGPIGGVQSITVAPEVSFGYDLPLNDERSWMASIELGYQVLIPGYVAGIDWYSHALKVQVSVAHDSFKTRERGRRRTTQLEQGQEQGQ